MHRALSSAQKPMYGAPPAKRAKAAAAPGAEELDIADVGDAIRQLLEMHNKPGNSPSAVCSALYNPNSNIRRRMLSRKFSQESSRDRVRVYHGLDEYLR